MTTEILKDWRLLEGEDEGTTSEVESVQQDDDIKAERTPDDEPGKGYNPNGRPAIANKECEMGELGVHSSRLYQALIFDKRAMPQVDQSELWRVIKRLQGQDPLYKRWSDSVKDNSPEIDASELMKDIRHGALTWKEWNLFWSGLGGFLDQGWRDIATRRHKYEERVQTPLPKGWWTRITNADARKRLIGSGDRGEPIPRQVLADLEVKLSSKGECPLKQDRCASQVNS